MNEFELHIRRNQYPPNCNCTHVRTWSCRTGSAPQFRSSRSTCSWPLSLATWQADSPSYPPSTSRQAERIITLGM